jgi:hypothetical protein
MDDFIIAIGEREVKEEGCSVLHLRFTPPSLKKIVNPIAIV